MWQDTVIKLNCGGILSDIEVEYYNRGAEAQALISFKKGIDFALSQDGIKQSLEGIKTNERKAGEQEGKRIVVEWVEANGGGSIYIEEDGSKSAIPIMIEFMKWQAQQKKWFSPEVLKD